jgi:cystathionine beta-lyase/cystathionine gamma-synthase
MKKIKAFFNTLEEFRTAIATEDKTFIYARGAEPSVEVLNKLMAKLEGTESALSFSSGVAAISAVLFTFLKAGDHIIYHKHSYSWARYLIQHHCHKFGIASTEIDESEMENIDKYIQPQTKMIYIENPSYFYFESLKLNSVFNLAQKHSILTVLDNSYLGPANLKPHLQKFDIILHSATKIICGKGDAMGGIVCSSEKLKKILFKDGLMSLGAVMTSQVAELMTQRMESYFQRTAKIADEMKVLYKYLKNNPKVDQVHYPWDLDSAGNWMEHSDYKFPVGLLSFELKVKDQTQIEMFADSLSLVKKGVSYGSSEALIIPSILFLKKGETATFPLGICRLSIGEQSAIDVIKDIESALEKSKV